MKHDLQAALHGELQIELRGQALEQLLNAALTQGIRLRGIRRIAPDRILCQLALPDLYRLRPLLRGRGVRLRVRGRYGLPFFLAFLQRRPLLPLCAVLGALLLTFCASLVSTITVTSPEPLPETDAALVLDLAAEAGIREGASRWRMDLEAAEQAILEGFPALFYAEIFRHGSALEIHVVKRVDVPEEEQLRPPGNIVATQAGVIEDILVRRGTAAVAAGDTVSAGDILIYGVSGSTLLTADGIVTATVYAEGYGECAEQQYTLRPTGASHRSLSLRFAHGHSLILLGGAAPEYAHASSSETVETLQLWRKIPLPVELIFRETLELAEHELHYTPQQARRLAEAQAEQNACAALPQPADGAPLGEITLFSEVLPLDDGIQRVRVVAQTTMRIGVYQPLSEEQAAEYGAAGKAAQ